MAKKAKKVVEPVVVEPEEMLTMKDVMEITGLTYQQFYSKVVKKGKIPFTRTGNGPHGGAYEFKKSDVDALQAVA